MNGIALYKYNVNNALMLWIISSDGNTIVIRHGQANGAMQIKTEVVEVNQSGRDLEAQVALRMQSRVNKQIDKGYCASIEEAEASKGLNASKLLRPMLAKKFRDVNNIDFNDAWLQYKYNGHRCLITNIDGELVAYSRNGKPITSIDHILSGLSIPEGMTIDGELYHHGTSLQTIGSWIKRNQPESKKLQYIGYDVILNTNYAKRLDILHKHIGSSENVIIAPSQACHDDLIIKDRLTDAINSGYEGLMLRQNKYAYAAGSRSQSLIKVKKCLDQEFLVLNVLAAKDAWGILECLAPSGDRTFRVSAPGTIDNKRHILYNRQDYIGKYITVEFFEWTNDGIPFHPVATNWRS
jgi:ATP-dependent DNA ligase